ncbi:MAG: L-rhamnose mutarotase [Planctomycetes bacterium]|jgi:L-rhamnose mutarotase|nr:L-rhamnose mutarotase [Planctomycetota bacterium]MCC7061609.1 L-rhamnose mutarotase [Planctomycetota bacterium]
MKRHGIRLGVRAECLAEYTRYHVRIWPEIEAAIHAAGIRNYSIFHFQGELFGYYEYVGPPEQYAERMRTLAAAPRMREWWDIMEAMQIPHPARQPGEWWAAMEEVFHQD